MATSELGRKRVTLAEIAREAGVSVGLVSAFLSGKRYAEGSGSGIRIGAETAARIRDICRQLDYQPERVETYRLIYPELAPVGIVGSVRDQFQTNRYHSLILDGVMAATTAASLSLMMLQYDPHTDYEAHPELLPVWVREAQVNKCILAGPPNESLLRVLVRQGVHVVYASRDPGVPGVSAVVPDYQAAAAIAVRYLHGLGHRRLGFYGLSYFDRTYPARELLTGARAALAELKLEGRFHVEAPPKGRSHTHDNAALDSFLESPEPVTAVFALDDLSAEHLAHQAMARGLRVPDDLSIVGCNDERQAAMMHPPLTTIHLPVFEIGRQSVELANELASGPAPATQQCLTLPVFLVERASTRHC